MPVILPRDKPRISKRIAIIISATVGAVYFVITLILIIVFLCRRRKKRLIREARLAFLNSPETLYLGFGDYLPSSRGGTRSQIYIRSPTRRLNHHNQVLEVREESGDEEASLRSPGSRPPTRGLHHVRRFSFSTISTDSRLATRRLGHGHRRNVSDGTILRSQTSANNPFWMFDSAYSYNSSPSHESSFHTFRRHSLSSLSPRPSPTYSHSPDLENQSSRSALSMPTSVFVSEMNARYPSAAILPPLSISSKSLAHIRQVQRSRSVSPKSPSSPTSTVMVVRELRAKQADGFLPPVPIVPLIRKRSFERIVSGEYFAHRKSRSRDKGKGRARSKARARTRTRERMRIRAQKSGEIVRLVTVKRATRGKEKKVGELSDREGGAHARMKSLSALSEWFGGFWKGKKGVVEGGEKEDGVVADVDVNDRGVVENENVVNEK